MSEDIDFFNLDNQLCFALYVCSKEIIRRYKPMLEPLGLTYTSYIAMMALWEKDNISVNELGHRLYLDSGTLTPLLKKMEQLGFLKRVRSAKDERTVIISLTEEGKKLKESCSEIPSKMLCTTALPIEKGKKMLNCLHEMCKTLVSDDI